jgi:hypothetical protein
VDDLATALLMRQFYREWGRGAVSIAEALRRAQRWLRTRSRAEVDAALAELDQLWVEFSCEDAEPAMRDRAIRQYWMIRLARERLAEDIQGHRRLGRDGVNDPRVLPVTHCQHAYLNGHQPVAPLVQAGMCACITRQLTTNERLETRRTRPTKSAVIATAASSPALPQPPARPPAARPSPPARS